MIESLRDLDVDSLNGVQRITNAADLPPAEATGRHELVDSTAYWFDDFVVSLVARAELEPNDYLELWLANEGGTGDITISTLDLTV